MLNEYATPGQALKHSLWFGRPLSVEPDAVVGDDLPPARAFSLQEAITTADSLAGGCSDVVALAGAIKGG
jgi:hypothetical protein